MTTFATAALDRMHALGVDCTYRQLDYWCRLGYLGERFKVRMPGWRREFDTSDLELLYAIAGVRKIANNTSFDLHSIVDALRARPVSVDGEILVVTDDGTSRRFGSIFSVRADELSGPSIVVPLRSFADVGSDPDVATAGTEPHPVPATHFP